MGAGVADKMVVVRLPKGIIRNVAMDMGSIILMDVVTINEIKFVVNCRGCVAGFVADVRVGCCWGDWEMLGGDAGRGRGWFRDGGSIPCQGCLKCGGGDRSRVDAALGTTVCAGRQCPNTLTSCGLARRTVGAGAAPFRPVIHGCEWLREGWGGRGRLAARLSIRAIGAACGGGGALGWRTVGRAGARHIRGREVGAG